jgi:hypothetical protein
VTPWDLTAPYCWQWSVFTIFLGFCYHHYYYEQISSIAVACHEVAWCSRNVADTNWGGTGFEFLLGQSLSCPNFFMTFFDPSLRIWDSTSGGPEPSPSKSFLIHFQVKWSEVKWSGVKGSKLWRGYERCVSVVKWNEGKIMVKCECISSWHYVFYYCYCLVHRILILY